MNFFSQGKRPLGLMGAIAAVLVLAPVAALADASPGVEPGTRAFLEAVAAAGGPGLETLAPVDARAVLAKVQAGAVLPAADVSEKTIDIAGKPLKLTIVRPAGVTGTLPAFMFFHGGGWILGDFPTHERLVRDLVSSSGAAAVFVNFSPSPESRYPVAIEQAYAATRWVADNGDSLQIDGSRLSVAGNSVGGNMATVVALMAKERGSPKLRSQLLLWPVTDASFSNASYRKYSKNYFLSRNMMTWFWNAYTTDPVQRRDVHASPLRASRGQLANLPPALVITAENDVLRDEGEAYAASLAAAGVPVVSTRYNGMIHDFGLLNALSALPATRAAIAQAGDALKTSLK